MTEKEKAKAYDEALEKAKQIIVEHGYDEHSNVFMEIFPELEESEDERVKSCISMILTDANETRFNDFHTTLADCFAWLKKQGEKKDNNKLIWKHWSTGIAGNGDGEPIYLIKYYNTYSISSCLSSECDYILLSDLDKLISDGDVDVRYKYLEDILAADDIYQMSMNDTMVEEAKSKASEALSKMSIGKLLGIKNQDEQKPADKVEPKFKAGDWVIRNNEYTGIPVQVIEFKGYYRCNLNGEVVTITPNDVHNNFHLWTIQDAKDGDVLCVKYGNDEMPFIFTGKQDNVAYCALNSFGEFVLSIAEWLLKISVLPATKEQHDTLFAKMKEAGYEWDAEKKELKKISQRMVSAEAKEVLYNKPTWSEDDVYNSKLILSTINQDQDLSLETKDKLTSWLKSIRPQPKQEWKEENIEELTEFENTMMHIGGSFFGENAGLDPNDTAMIKEQAKLLLELAPKTEWNEEDEHRINRISYFIWKNGKGDTDEIYQQEQDVNWLKSLKNKVQPQPKHEWSEEDKKMIGRIRSIVEKYAFSQSAVDVNGDLCEKEYIDTDNWLKSLKDRVRPKQEWSKEDEHRINRISDFIWKNRKGDTDEIYQQEQDVNWLKSIKDHVQLKQEWSEEDKEFINDLIGVFDGQQYQAHSDEEIVKWLKSIRLPYNKEWNENDEEMLKSIIATCELACEDRDSSPARHLLQMQTDWLKSLKQRHTWKPSEE